MDDLVAGEELAPDRVVEAGRERRRRRRAAASVGGAAAVLIVASGVAYGIGSSGPGSGAAPASGHSATARVTRPASPSAAPASELKGRLVSEGTTSGVSWKIGAALAGYSDGNAIPQFCVYVWTSNGSTDPTACEGPVQPDPADPDAPSFPQAGAQYGLMSKSSTIGWAAIYTSDATKVVVTYDGGSITLHPVSLGHGVDVTGAVLPKSGATMVASGPGGTGVVTHLKFTPPGS
ncbi:hypothetical protein [Actinospica robiniae]|uniref:hypothetical protein n=1 Tax=Actinospica robiniae TaxID=304901 RepID=UPI0004125916|nr:hypothetical protein [Actinospica robiniae]